jgi:hypothetical protein
MLESLSVDREFQKKGDKTNVHPEIERTNHEGD